MPSTDQNLQRKYLTYLAQNNGDKQGARVLAGIRAKDLKRWRDDDATDKNGDTFEEREMIVLAQHRSDLRRRVREVIYADDEEGLPKFPAQVMAAAKAQLPEFAPQRQTIDHNVKGQLTHSHHHQTAIDQMPKDLLERFIETGESPIELDRIAEDTWGKER